MNRCFQILLGSALTLFVCAGYATIKDVASDDKVLNLSDICQVMLHVSKTKNKGKVDFIFFPSDAFIRSVEDNEFVEPAVLDLTQMPMYENFKTYGINNKCWSGVKVESQNEYIYFTFLEEKGGPNQTTLSVLVDSIEHGIDLKEGSANYGISLDSIKNNNNKIHFFHKEAFSRSGVLSKPEDETKPQKKQRLKYQQIQLWQTWLFKNYPYYAKQCLKQSVSFLQYNAKIIVCGVIMMPLRFIISSGLLCKKTISNISLYALVFGSHFAVAVLGSGSNDSQPVGVESLTTQYSPFNFIDVPGLKVVWPAGLIVTTGAVVILFIQKFRRKGEKSYSEGFDSI